ncbi:MAG: hypothetical protein SFV19_06685 [Rhodospirillaceae bacterium]|nr:hypothetical protein [Rhodospirillaceae bacterium]
MPRGAGGAGLRTPSGAPSWLQGFAREIETWADARLRGPMSLTVYSKTALPTAADYPFALVAVSDGAGGKYAAVSNGTAWYYLDGTAV